MSELQVESMNAVEMTVGEIANIPLANDSTTRIINAVSPTATVVKDGTTATITITDKNGTTTATISDGETGATGPAAYVHIRYAEDEPAQDSDMKTEPDAWMGVYSGSSETAPTHYTDYRWGKIQGEQGEQGEPGEGVPAGGSAGLFLKKSSSTDYDTEWDSVPDPQTMTGATSSAAGTGGLVPAPSAGANVYFLRGDATWAIPAGGKLIVKDLDTVTNTSGSYTHSTSLSDVTSEMKAVMIELGNPSAFRDAISITTANGSITLACNSVAGTSTVKVSMMFVAGADAITSSEFDVLAGRIGNLSSLTTTAKTSTVAAINELDSDIGSISDQIATLNSKLTIISSGSLHDIKTCGAYYLTNAVTDKPTSTGGSYVVGSNGNVVSGIFTQNSTGNTYAVRFDGSTWTYEQLALNSNLTNAIVNTQHMTDATIISDLNDIPVGTKGRVKFASALRPNSNATLYNYDCFGEGNTRTLVVSNEYYNETWVNYKNGSSWSGWQGLATNSNPLFGSVKHFKYTKSSNSEISLDTVLDEYSVTDTPTIGVDVQGTITNCGGANHSFILSWRNGGNTYCWALVMNFSGIYFATRLGSSTYTITKLN